MIYCLFFYVPTPSNFNSGNAIANVWNVNSTGNIGNNNVSTSLGVRPDSYYELVMITNEPSIID